MSEEEDKKDGLIGPAPTREEMVKEMAKVDSGYQSYLDSIPDEVSQRITGHVKGMKHGLRAMAPLICPGFEECLFKSHCPIPVRGVGGKVEPGPPENYPIGRPCVLEKFYLQQKTIDYVQHLEVDPDNPVEMSIINELSTIDLLKNRALMILSEGDRDNQGVDFMRVDIMGYSEYGGAAQSTHLHPAVEIIDKMEKRREKWLDKLMETRKAKADLRLKAGQESKPSQLTETLSQVKGLLEDMSKSKEPLDLNEKLALDD